jgi:pentatricopeptide repeat protein
MTANSRQVGGRHYKTEYEHWDLALNIPMGYLVGCSTKYVMRARKKNGLEDLNKALHYLDKLIENFEKDGPPLRYFLIDDIELEVEKFAAINELTAEENNYIYLLCSYAVVDDLERAKHVLQRMIKDNISRPGTPEDGGHHDQDQEELSHRRGTASTHSA